MVMMSFASPGLRVGEKEDLRSKFPADHEELEFTPTRRKSGPAGLGTYMAHRVFMHVRSGLCEF